jgi:hypothetical protein
VTAAWPDPLHPWPGQDDGHDLAGFHARQTDLDIPAMRGDIRRIAGYWPAPRAQGSRIEAVALLVGNKGLGASEWRFLATEEAMPGPYMSARVRRRAPPFGRARGGSARRPGPGSRSLGGHEPPESGLGRAAATGPATATSGAEGRLSLPRGLLPSSEGTVTAA